MPGSIEVKLRANNRDALPPFTRQLCGSRAEHSAQAAGSRGLAGPLGSLHLVALPRPRAHE
jgi:hypothetical protein